MQLTALSVEVIDNQPARALAGLSVGVVDNQPARSLVGLSVDIPLLQNSPAGSLVGLSVEVVDNTPARSLLNFNVAVMNKSLLGQRWEAVVMLGGVDISDRVCGAVSTGGAVGQNRTATFEMKNPQGVIDPDVFINQPVTIDYFQPDGTVNRIFTGFVETPTYVFENGRTRIVASTLKDKRLDQMTRSQINRLVGGRWSKYVMTEDAEGADYAADRLRTVAADICVDARGVLRRVPWGVGAVDYTLTGDDLSEVRMGVTLQDAKSLKNSIKVTVEYRYTRLRHRERDYHWDAPGVNYWGDFMAKQYPLVPKTLIRSAIDTTGWALMGNVSYQDVPTGGWFNVNGTKQGWINPEAGKYATAADWSMATRFTQTITERYSLTFTAPESVEVWGKIPATSKSHGVVAEFADDEWDDMDVYTGPDANAVQSPNGDWVVDATDTEEGGRSSFNEALRVVLDMYQRELLDAHRKNYVDLNMPKRLWAEIDIHHTVQIVCNRLNCIARVYSVNHSFDRVRGTRGTVVRLVLSRAPAVGAYNASPLVVPAKPDSTDQSVNVSTIKMGVHLGNTYGAPGLDEAWTGYISNYTYYDKVAQLQQYPTAFIVDTPAIEESDREERTAERVQAFNVLIPDDALEIINVRNDYVVIVPDPPVPPVVTDEFLLAAEGSDLLTASGENLIIGH